jgi:hypothetical protein
MPIKSLRPDTEIGRLGGDIDLQDVRWKQHGWVRVGLAAGALVPEGRQVRRLIRLLGRWRWCSGGPAIATSGGKTGGQPGPRPRAGR